jgi:hypothetical protein
MVTEPQVAGQAVQAAGESVGLVYCNQPVARLRSPKGFATGWFKTTNSRTVTRSGSGIKRTAARRAVALRLALLRPPSYHALGGFLRLDAEIERRIASPQRGEVTLQADVRGRAGTVDHELLSGGGRTGVEEAN